jgi:hypothetical protein
VKWSVHVRSEFAERLLVYTHVSWMSIENSNCLGENCMLSSDIGGGVSA